jgi:hypothetical protein
LWINNNGGNNKPLLLNLLSTIKPVYMPTLFADASGTVDAAALGGQVQQTSLTTSEVAFPSSGVITVTYNRDEFIGKNIYLLASMKDASASTINSRVKITDNAVVWAAYSAPYNTLTTTNTFQVYLAGPMQIPEAFDDYAWAGTASNFKVYWSMLRSSGTQNINFDYYRAMIGDIAYFPSVGTSTYYLVRNGTVKGYTSTAFVEIPEYRGDILELKPNRYNYLVIWSQGLAATTDFTQATNVIYAYVTPRWALV